MDENKKLLDIRSLSVRFKTSEGIVTVVNELDLSVEKGEVLGVVGESGSGKSMTSLAVMGLISKSIGIVEGEIIYRGKNLITAPEDEMRQLRGKQISMIFQEPMTSLNPVYTVGDQIVESLLAHEKISADDARKRAISLLAQVGIPSPEERAKSYPHQLSGGMRQRVMLAMGLSCNPDILIADEPTTALDVTIQAQILELISRLQREHGMSVILITHALGIVAEMADRVAVMYAGRIMELAETEVLFGSPAHTYTVGLMHSIPKMSGSVEPLKAIPGSVPTPNSLPKGCKFSNRCEFADAKCEDEEPKLSEVVPGHFCRCWKPCKGDVVI